MKKIFTISLILLSLTLKAQYNGNKTGGENMPKDGNIKGIIKDNIEKTVIEYANVVLYSARDSTVVAGQITKADGTFNFDGLGYGRYYVTVDFIGYFKNKIDNVKVNPKNKTYDCGDISLSQATQTVDQVVVAADKTQMQYKIDKKVINISQNLNASGGTLVDALENVPSIKVDVEGNVSLRGSSNFLVLIDGKPSVLSAGDALSQIPTTSVENIEIITNPSAKFDPEGTTGIINIVMKKQFSGGFNGIINVTGSTNKSYSTDFLVNYRSKKFNLYFGGETGNRAHDGEMNSKKETYGDTIRYLETLSKNQNWSNSYSGKFGIDYFLDSHNTFSFVGNAGYFGMNRNSFPFYADYDNINITKIYSLSNSENTMKGYQYSGTFDYIHKFFNPDHNIRVSAFYSFFPGESTGSTEEFLSDENRNELSLNLKNRSTSDRTSSTYIIKTDYVYPINDIYTFEAGIQSNISSKNVNYIFEDYNYTSKLFENNPNFSNNMDFTQNIYSAYSTFSGSFLTLNYKAGLRGEYLNRLIFQKLTDEKYPIERFDLFPTMHISKEFNDRQQLQVSYSRRTRRPDDMNLNPFRSASDSRSVRMGNPALKPEFIDSYELSFQNRFGKTLVVAESYYRKTNDGITRIQLTDENNIKIFTFDNISRSDAFGLELSANIDAAKWFKIFVSGNLYQYKLDANITGMSTADKKSTNFDMSLNPTISFGTNSRLQISSEFEGPTVTAQGKSSAEYKLDFAYRHEFFKKQLSVVLRARDPFKISSHKFTIDTDYYRDNIDFIHESQVFTLSLSYKLNNYSQKREEKGENGGDGGFDM